MKIAVVTGASSGMGREFVLQISRTEQLDEIWVIARRANRLEDLQKVFLMQLSSVTFWFH